MPTVPSPPPRDPRTAVVRALLGHGQGFRFSTCHSGLGHPKIKGGWRVSAGPAQPQIGLASCSPAVQGWEPPTAPRAGFDGPPFAERQRTDKRPSIRAHPLQPGRADRGVQRGHIGTLFAPTSARNDAGPRPVTPSSVALAPRSAACGPSPDDNRVRCNGPARRSRRSRCDHSVSRCR